MITTTTMISINVKPRSARRSVVEGWVVRT
jgi:hypothetical protein